MKTFPMKLVTIILCLFFFEIDQGDGQKAVPSWERHVDEEGDLTVAAEFPHHPSIIAVIKNRNLSPLYRNYFFITDKFGKELLKKEFKNDTLDIAFIDIAWSKEINKFILFGIATPKRPFEDYWYDQFITVQVDDQLNFTGVNIKKTGTLYRYRFGKAYNNGKEFLTVLTNHWNGFLNDQFETTFIRVSYTGEILYSYFIRDSQGSCQCILPNIHNNGYYCPGIVGYNLDSNLVFNSYEGLKTNSPLNHLSDYYNNSDLFLFDVTKSCFPWTDGNYLICNTYNGYERTIPYRSGQTVLFILSGKNSDSLKTVAFGSGRRAFSYQSMDITKDSMIYSGNYDFTKSIITIAKFDKKLKKVWQMEYSHKDYINYWVSGIKTTHDDGFIIYGNRLINKQSIDYIPFLTRFDKNGGIVSSTDGFELNAAIRVYPNPFTQYLQLDLQTFGPKVEFRLFDLSGRNVFVQHHLDTGLHTIDFSELPSGAYVYKLYQNGKEIAGDKCVKIQE